MGDKDVAYVGPYRATKVWNDVIAAFRQYLPCGRHRRYMKTFDNCFSGSAAIEWLLHYLKTNDSFQSDISRAKAASLVNKLYHAGIFEEVQVTRSMRHKAEVQENRLYRFLPISPSKIKISRLPLAPRNDSGLFQSIANSKSKENNPGKVEKSDNSENNVQTRLTRKISILKKEKAKKESGAETAGEISYPPCHIITRILTTKEIKDTWKAIFTQRLKKVLGVTQLGDIVSGDLIDGYNIMHNCIYLNKSGVVTNIDAAEQLPHWVMSAMKCLAHWPEPAEPGLPSYPGFEKDVFRVIRDYFLALDEPLVPFSLKDVFTAVFVMCGQQPVQPPLKSSPREEDSEEFIVPSSLWTSASLENIILNLTKKYCTLDNVSQHYGTCEDLRSPGASSQRQKLFVSQEDLRFAGHVENYLNDYNKSAFPSTDGMDRVSTHAKSLSRFASQESCPSLPSREFLSKSTQSAGNARQSRNQGGFRRAYGSTPNLKVSKYETAFGPDNRTVTRVFYQNGLTTDLSHDDEDDESDEVFPCVSLPNKTFSTSMLVNQTETSGVLPETNRSKLRGNMAYDVNCVQILKSQSYSTLDKNHKLQDHTSTARDSSKTEKMNVSIGQSISLPQSQHNCSQASIHRAPEAPAETLGHCRQDPDQSAVYKNSSATPSPAVRSVVTSPAVFYPSEEKKTPVHQGNQSSLLKEMYGPGYRPPTRTWTRSRSQVLPLGVRHTSTSSLHSLGQGREDQHYRPVLDAAKGRNLKMSNTSSPSPYLLEPQAPCVKHNTSQDCESNRDWYTSTPMSASFDNADLLCPSCPPSSIAAKSSTFNKGFSTSCSTRFMNYPQTRLSEERARNCLQLVALLLPPGNRRKLHLLFKLMVKMTSNPNLCLDPTQTTRSLVLSTFYRSILRSQTDEDEMVVLQLVSFMLDFYAEILSPPDNIKTQVSERLKVLQNPQVVYSPRPDRAVQFCQQVSSAEFENQRQPSSQMSALEELLENIVRSENMTDKEKRRRLKQFQRTYPAVYTRRFPTPESEATVLPQLKAKPKIKQPFAIKPLQHKFKGLRL